MANQKKKKSQPEIPKNEQVSESESSQKQIAKRDLVFDVRFLEDLTYWVETNRKMAQTSSTTLSLSLSLSLIALRLLSIIEEIGRNPFAGTGKPEQLKYYDANVWSRRLTERDRIVYTVSADRIEFLQARYHYSDR